jgi:hypothetical protein
LSWGAARTGIGVVATVRISKIIGSRFERVKKRQEISGEHNGPGWGRRPEGRLACRPVREEMEPVRGSWRRRYSEVWLMTGRNGGRCPRWRSRCPGQGLKETSEGLDHHYDITTEIKSGPLGPLHSELGCETGPASPSPSAPLPFPKSSHPFITRPCPKSSRLLPLPEGQIEYPG